MVYRQVLFVKVAFHSALVKISINLLKYILFDCYEKANYYFHIETHQREILLIQFLFIVLDPNFIFLPSEWLTSNLP